MNGLLLLNKPANITSFRSIDLVKKKFRLKKIGHAGTIDFFAGGLLIVGINEGTKLLNYYLGRDKAYKAIFRLGMVTDTFDPSGRIVSEFKGVLPGMDEVKRALGSFIGVISQTPPEYSAVKIKGKRASERVRSGEKISLNPKKVEVYSIELEKFDIPLITLSISCSKGTYIRALARDLGSVLGCGATVVNLIRTSIDPFSVEMSIGINEILGTDTLEKNIIPLRDAIPFFRELSLNDREKEDIIKGRSIVLGDVIDSTHAIAVHNNKLVGVVRIEKTSECYIAIPDRIMFD